MKKILSIALAVVMVLSLASVAMAFNWAAPTSSSSDFGYQIEVIKFTSMTQAYGSASFQVDDAATAVNGAPVYFAIRLTVPDLSKDNDIRKSAKAKVEFTAISGVNGTGSDGISIANLDKGVYYYYDKTNSFEPIGFFRANLLNMNVVSETPVYAMTCLDTDTAKVYAEVTSNRPLASTFNAGDYDIVKTTISNAEVSATKAPAMTVTTYGSEGTAQVISLTFEPITGDGTSLYNFTYTFGDKSFTTPKWNSAGGNHVEGEMYNAFNGVENSLVTINGVVYAIQFGAIDGTITLTEKGTQDAYGVTHYADLGGTLPTIGISVDSSAVSSIKVVEFRKASTPMGKGALVAVLPLNSDSKVLGIVTSNEEATAFDPVGGDPIQVNYTGKNWAGSAAVIDLYEWLDDGNAGSFKDAVKDGLVYMTDSNMRAAFGYANKVSDQITWQANSTPIILDPTVSIPKTGDNASVIGFAMIMAAVVLAAVAVKKVKA